MASLLTKLSNQEINKKINYKKNNMNKIKKKNKIFHRSAQMLIRVHG